MLVYRAGHALEFDKLDPEKMLGAMIKSFKGNERPLAREIKRLVL